MRRLIVLAAAAAFCVGSVLAVETDPSPPRWNVVLVTKLKDAANKDRSPFPAVTLDFPAQFTLVLAPGDKGLIDTKKVQAIEFGEGPDGKDLVVFNDRSEKPLAGTIEIAGVPPPGFSFQISNDNPAVRLFDVRKVLTKIIFVNPCMPAAVESGDAKPAAHKLYFMDGLHYGFVNDFGTGPYVSSSRYAKVLPGMTLTVRSDGSWTLQYRMLTMGVSAQVNWELCILFQDDVGVPRRIPLQSMLRFARQSQDDAADRGLSHSGTHPAIHDYFHNLCGEGVLLTRKGNVLFEVERDWTVEKQHP